MNYPHRSSVINNPGAFGHWQEKIPVISTAHITKEDGLMLCEGLDSCVLDSVFDGTGHLLRTSPEYWPAAPKNGRVWWSTQILVLVQAFYSLGYRWIILDGEGDKIPGLPTFDW